MTTIINRPAPSTDNGTNSIVVGVVSVLVLVLLFIYFGLPAIRRVGNSQYSIPGPQINVPNQIDINVKQTP